MQSAPAVETTRLRKEPKRLPRVGVRWLERYLQECEPTLAQVALAVSALSALADEERTEAVRVLRALRGGAGLAPAAGLIRSLSAVSA